MFACKLSTLPKPEYIYRIPRSTRYLYATLINLPTLLFVVAAGVQMRSWLVGISAIIPVLLTGLTLWLWSKAIIAIDGERIRWPLTRIELRWNDVATSRIVRLLGTEYARVETKNGKVRRIVLNRVGGQEYRVRVLAKLALD